MRFYKNIVQGDSYRTKVIIKKGTEKLDYRLINKIFFTSKELNIHKEAEWDEELEDFIFTLAPNETAKFKCGNSTFDITVKFTPSSIKTVTYEGEFIICQKHNPI